MSDWSLFDTLTAIPDAGKERNRLIAETWMGWKHTDGNEPLRLFVDDGGFIENGRPLRFTSRGVASSQYFDPSCDIAAAYSLEEVINEKGYSSMYVQCLAVVLLESGIPNNEEDQWWQFAHATPEQRSKAALVAWAKMQAHKKDGE